MDRDSSFGILSIPCRLNWLPVVRTSLSSSGFSTSPAVSSRLAKYPPMLSSFSPFKSSLRRDRLTVSFLRPENADRPSREMLP